MRICIVAREPSGREGLGDGARARAEALASAGHEVFLLAGQGAARDEGAPVAGAVTVQRVEAQSGAALLPGFGSTHARDAWALHEQLSALHRRHRFDWIDLCSSGGAGYFALCAKHFGDGYREAILSVRVAPGALAIRQANRAYALDLSILEQAHLEDASIRLADVVFAPTRALLAEALERTGRDGPSAVVPLVQRPDATPRTSTLRPRPGVLYVGTLEHRAGLHTLVAAACALFERGLSFDVEFCGPDSDTGPFGRSFEQWLRRQLPARWRDRFTFTRPGSAEEVGRALDQASVCCFPWLQAPELTSCLSAMARGRAVVHSDAAGPEGLAGEGTALTFAQGDERALAGCLERLLGSESLRRQLGVTAQERIASSNAPEGIVRQLEGLISAETRSTAHGPERSPVRATGTAPRVSVIVPFFNLHAFLPQTLASIDAQTDRDLELIIVDDGSTDPESLRLLEALERAGRHVVRKENGGLSSARNAGLAVARGRYVLPLDADDLIAETFVEKTVTVLERDPTLAYATTLVSRFVTRPSEPVGVYIPWGVARDALPLTNVASTCTALLSREAVESAGGYDEWLTSFEDWDLYCTLAEQGLRGAVVPEFLFHYRTRPDSLVHTEVLQRRHALMAYLIAKHPRLAEHPDRTLRAMLGAHSAELAERPLRYRAADAVNAAIKGLPWVQPLLKRGLELTTRARKRKP